VWSADCKEHSSTQSLPAETIVGHSSTKRILVRMTTKVFLQLLVYASVFALFTMPQAMGEQECYGEKETFKQKCNLSIKLGSGYIHPTDSCCRTAQKVDMACVCRIITSEEEREIDLHYVFWVSQDCHNPVPAGKKCGSWTIPGSGVPPPPHHYMQQ
ncbi:hypothetical protein EJB05_11981, partial [Eragrostis curvula]